MTAPPLTAPPSLPRPPWHLRGDAHVLMLWVPRGIELGGQFLPAGWRLRQGGLALLMFVRYRASDVGPYDELLWLWPWGVSAGGAWRHCVTSIIVSTEASCVAGRENWGLPKRVGRFTVQRAGESEHVEVALEGERVAAFDVKAGLRSVPFDAAVFPARLRSLWQELDEKRFQVAPTARGRLRQSRFSALQFGSERFPDASRARPLRSVSLSDFEMTFPSPRVTPAGARG